MIQTHGDACAYTVVAHVGLYHMSRHPILTPPPPPCSGLSPPDSWRSLLPSRFSQLWLLRSEGGVGVGERKSETLRIGGAHSQGPGICGGKKTFF